MPTWKTTDAVAMKIFQTLSFYSNDCSPSRKFYTDLNILQNHICTYMVLKDIQVGVKFTRWWHIWFWSKLGNLTFWLLLLLLQFHVDMISLMFQWSLWHYEKIELSICLSVFSHVASYHYIRIFWTTNGRYYGSIEKFFKCIVDHELEVVTAWENLTITLV